MSLDIDRMEESRLLRQLSLAIVIPLAFPGATVSPESQGAHTTRWILPDGSKLNVLQQGPAGPSDAFRFYTGPWAEVGGAGAVDFLLKTGVVADFRAAKAWLLTHTALELMPAQRSAVPAHRSPQPFHLPDRDTQPDRAWALIRHYLVDERRLPEALVRVAVETGAVYAGSGYYAGYVLFPCRNHRRAGDTPATGAMLRWADPARTPTALGGAIKAVAPRTDRKAGWWEWGTGRQTLIIVEAPIDALTVIAALESRGQSFGVSVMAFGGSGGLNPAQLQGFSGVIAATDADHEGDRLARHILDLAQPSQSVQRLMPPVGYKDWNAAWQHNPTRVAQTWGPARLGTSDPSQARHPGQPAGEAKTADTELDR